jgi:GNAT superfamily N-acetyltransferase
MNKKLKIVKAIELDLATLAELFNDAFAGYIGGEVQFDTASLFAFLSHEGVDLNLSQVALRAGEPVALAFIARRGWTSRLAAMGVARGAQGQGLGRWLLQKSIEQAHDRGDQRYVLECIEQNERGVRLYRGAGFRIVRRLVSFRFEARADLATSGGGDGMADVDIATVACLVAGWGGGDLPWQLSGHSLAHLGPPHVAHQLGLAYAVLSLLGQEIIVLRSFFVLPQDRGQGHGRRLFQALRASYPGKTWRIPALCPEEYGGFFARLGFVPDRLSQFQMEIDTSK